MTGRKDQARLEDGKALLAEDGDFLRPLVQVALQELFEAEMTEALAAEKDERTPSRLERYQRSEKALVAALAERETGVIGNQAVLLAIGIGWDGRRSILAVELANRESRSSWREFFLQLRERGLSGVEFVVSDDHAGLRQAIIEVLPEATWQRCDVHFLRNALDYVHARSTTTACAS